MLGGIVALLISILRSGSKLKYFLWFSLCIGIAWEVFEIHYAITSFDDPGYWPDTFGDIFFDMFGSYVAYLFFKKSLNE